MSYPKARKNNINVYPQRELVERRKELLERISKSDTFLPDSILHDDLDLGMLEFIKENFKVISDGEEIPIIKKLMTIQRWGEFINNWTFSDEDGNVKLPFIAIIRKPEVQPGTNPSVMRTIPDRQQFFYATVPTWNGTQIGADIYKMPQPIPIDITFNITIICTKFRDINKLNKKILQKFPSRQAYMTVKGHYIPIVLDRIEDTTPMDTMDARRFYVQTYVMTVLGILIDDEEFKVTPAINRVLIMNEFTNDNVFNKKYINTGIDLTVTEFTASYGDTTFSVGELIDVLVLVTVNNVVKELNIDYYHVSTTSRIIFSSPLNNNDIVSITYFKSKNEKFTDAFGKPLNVVEETVIYSGDTQVFETVSPLQNLVCLDINNIVQNKEIDYNITGLKEFTLLVTPTIGSIIRIIYLF